ncbi:MAG: NINE protein [Methylococcales bacterium]|nr:NINE protein [Methylococcales bacterium]
MLGHIESYDEDKQIGIIKADDKSFEFHLDSWSANVPLKVGDDVDFIENEGEISDIGLVGDYVKDDRPVKRRWVASLLGLLLGAVGAHRFYLGFYTIGVLQIILTLATQGYGVMWGFIEAVLIFSGHIYKDGKGRPLK